MSQSASTLMFKGSGKKAMRPVTSGQAFGNFKGSCIPVALYRENRRPRRVGEVARSG